MILNKCCCCCNLKTGALVLAILFIIGSVGSVISAIVTGATVPNNAVYGFGVLLPVSLINLLFSSLLVHGIRTERPAFILPWLIYEGIILAAYTILIIVLAVFVPIIAIALLGAAIGLYFYLCILSYYQELKENDITGAARYDGSEQAKNPSSY